MEGIHTAKQIHSKIDHSQRRGSLWTEAWWSHPQHNVRSQPHRSIDEISSLNLNFILPLFVARSGRYEGPSWKPLRNGRASNETYHSRHSLFSSFLELDPWSHRTIETSTVIERHWTANIILFRRSSPYGHDHGAISLRTLEVGY